MIYKEQHEEGHDRVRVSVFALSASHDRVLDTLSLLQLLPIP